MADNIIIEVREVTRDFGEFRAVENLNLKIKKGEVFGFLGPNGAGKTTSINMMVGLLRPSRGQIFIGGESVEKIEKGTIGICPQELVLWDFLTCKESLMLMGDMYQVPREELKMRVQKLLDDLFLQDKANTVVTQLSGGMKRRLNLAMAVVHQPDIVVLDEPSEGLDPQSRRVLWNYIRSMRDDEGKTVILTTHLMDEADRLSDRIAIIDHGKLLRLDTPTNLKKEIGEGDVVEMKLSEPALNQEVISVLEDMPDVHSVVEIDDGLNVRALDAVTKLPQIIELVETMGGHVLDLSIRQNTLEDVFIDLTGTGLRE
ncbi:MAG TPA: ATP-binding cassette domain-containing protein [Methanobacterium subterraneum]|uniref:ATP-binding cassette domain-containing protein n=1 Tax=Methanobacterium subterraneum TaxID=59277 RepID=A0A7J4TJA7_9EURY|nr:ATP-binding cassette domain-containing protein [Methanobacterium subterraneum]